MRNLGTILAAAAASVLGAVLLPACMGDPMSGGAGTYDGPVSLTLNLGFDPLAESLATRGVAANLDFELRDLALFFYDGNADEQTPPPVKTYSFTDLRTEQAERVSKDGVDPHTRRTSVTLDDIASGSYRIYAAANVAETLADNGISDLSLLSESALRGLTVTWAPYAEDAGEDEQSPLRYAIPDAMYGFFDNGDEQEVIGKRAPVIALASKSVTLHAWLKRVVSRLTVGFDGSQLNDGVAIYIKSVRVRDAVAASPLGENNKAETERDLFSDTRTDPRLNHVWSAEEGVTDAAITNSTPAFPRPTGKDGISTRSDDGSGWNADWYEYVHGNAKTLDPAGPVDENTPVALYFMENMQGTAEPRTAHADDPTGEDFKKDGVLFGTYVEVEGYYVNSDPAPGKAPEGKIIYRFMLGQNITDDFNVERSRHYKLTLRFKGDPSDPDWHIEYPAMPYFRIPTEEEWEKYSYVWRAYNDDGEPIAEMVKELVYFNGVDGKQESDADRLYYQIVTVYPIKCDRTRPESDPYRYTTDLDHGMIAQVLNCDTKETLDLKAGGTISMYLRTQPNVPLYESRYSDAIRGDYIIKNLTNGGKENYYFVNVLSKSFTESVVGEVLMSRINTSPYYLYEENTAAESTKKFEYDLKLGEQRSYEYRIRPYRVPDHSGRTYPVVKIGASYWLRENLKALQYESSEAVYAFKPPVSTQFYDGETIYGNPDGYDYDFGPGDLVSGYVAFYERYPMYKTYKGEYLYNLFAASGTEGDPLGDGTFDYKKSTESDPWFYGTIGNLQALTQRGFIDSQYLSLNSNVKDWDTSEPYSLRNYSGQANLHLPPTGWHIPIINGYTLGEYGDIGCDHDYLEEYLGNNWERAMGDTENFVWPKLVGSPIKTRNLSGLTLLAIPLNWEDSDAEVSYETDVETGLINGKTDGVVIPFWGSELKEISNCFYSVPVYLCNDTRNYPGCIVNKFSQGSAINTLCKIANKSYIPIRCVRDSYDYSADKIGSRKDEPNIDRF